MKAEMLSQFIVPVLGQSARFIPFRLQQLTLESILPKVFAEALLDGDLDCLENKAIEIFVNDLNTGWNIGLVEGEVSVTPALGDADVTISGNAHEFFLLLSRQEDPDTLFFQRRLSIEGDTELGLEVKNLMDGIDPDSLPAPLRKALDAATHICHFLTPSEPKYQ